MRVLVVKDEKQKEKVLRRLLRKKGRVIAVVKSEEDLKNEVVQKAEVVVVELRKGVEGKRGLKREL